MAPPWRCFSSALLALKLKPRMLIASIMFMQMSQQTSPRLVLLRGARNSASYLEKGSQMWIGFEGELNHPFLSWGVDKAAECD